MARFCGGIKLDSTLKVINGVICDAAATTVDVTKAVTGCGQLWDGALFTKAFVNNAPVITLHNSEGEEVGTPVKVRRRSGWSVLQAGQRRGQPSRWFPADRYCCA